MLTLHHNIQAVIDQLRTVPPAIAAGHAAAMNMAHWKSRAIETARTTLAAIALAGEHPSIPHFLAGISLVPAEGGFVLRLDSSYDPKEQAARLDVRGIRNLPLFTAALAKSQEEAWYIVRDWVEFAKDIDERDEDEDGTVDYDKITARIHRILFRPESDQMLAGRERLMRSGKRSGGAYLLDFAAGMHAAGAYGLGQATARTWLQAVGNAWSELVRVELPMAMVTHLNAALQKV